MDAQDGRRRYDPRQRASIGAAAFVLLAALGRMLIGAAVLAQGAPAVPWPIVFVSRQIPDQGSIYWNVPRDQPGVGAHSRFRVASPGQLVVRDVDGSLRVLIDGAMPNATSLNLIDVNAPDVSYDGQWIALAGLPQGTYDRGPVTNPGAWRIYVMRTNGTGLRRVTPDENRAGITGGLQAYDDTDPCWLPDGRLVFTSTRWPSYAQYSGVRTSNLYVINSDGSGLHRITAERNGADRSLVDPVTGKIVFARWWRNHRFPLDSLATVADPAGGFIQKDGLSADRNLQMTGAGADADYLFRNAWHAATINPDGTGLAMWSGSLRTQSASGNDETNHMYGGGFSAAGELFANYFPMYNMTEAGGFGGIRKFTRLPNPHTPILGITTLSANYVHASGPTSYGIYTGPYVTEPDVLPDGRLIVSVATDINQDYGLYVANANGSGLTPLYDRAGTTELRARAIRPRPLPPVIADTVTQVASAVPPPAGGPYTGDGTFVFDAVNVYFNAPVDTDIISAPAIGSAARIRFFIDHQRTSPGSFPNLDWPILLDDVAVHADGSVRAVAPANVPLFEQLRTSDGKVPLTGGPFQVGAGHVAGMNYGRPETTARCVGCHMGHSQIPSPLTDEEAKWTNLAPGARVDVSSTRDASYNSGLIDRRVMKGEIWRYWVSASGQFANQWVKLTFPVPIRIASVRLYNPRTGDEANSTLAVPSATVRLFSDAAATMQVATQAVGALAVGGTVATFTPTVAQAVRVDLGPVTGTFYGARAASLAEIEVIASGDTTGTAPAPTAGDADGDGMPDDWETAYGLNPSDPSDASADPDHDGVSNLDEYRRGTHPRGIYTRYFAEGSENSFFRTRFALLNPGTQPARVLLRFLKSDGTHTSHALDLAARRRVTLDARALAEIGQADFSTVIESDQLVVADRTMSWAGDAGYGAASETAIESPALTWYLAEGATHGGFDLFYLLQNPNDTAAQVHVRYLRPAGAPLDKDYTVAAQSRMTIWVDDEDIAGLGKALAATDVSAVIEVTNNQPIIAERAMYFSRPEQPFAAGHESAGVTAPKTSWFLAEGATGPFFDLYLLLANPNMQDADVQITYLLPDGSTLAKHYPVAAQSRVTISVDNEEFPAGSGQRLLDNVAVSSIVESTNNVPIVVERSMWWPSPNWYEAHNSPGATKTATRWAVAEGEAAGPSAASTYVLIANTSTFAGSAVVTVLYEDGGSAQKTLALASSSRTNVNVLAEFPEAAGRRFGVVVESLAAAGQSLPAQLVVERSMYYDAAGVPWAAGTNALAAILP
jgi:hypothetical protein